MDRLVSLSVATIALFGSGCDPTPSARVPGDSTPAAARLENGFDPATIERGDAVVGLVLDSIHRERTPSGEWVGTARFSGMVTINGRTVRHPDGDDYPFPCFEADSVSARRFSWGLAGFSYPNHGGDPCGTFNASGTSREEGYTSDCGWGSDVYTDYTVNNVFVRVSDGFVTAAANVDIDTLGCTLYWDRIVG